MVEAMVEAMDTVVLLMPNLHIGQWDMLLPCTWGVGIIVVIWVVVSDIMEEVTMEDIIIELIDTYVRNLYIFITFFPVDKIKENIINEFFLRNYNYKLSVFVMSGLLPYI
jgi:hypothetical protein